MSTLSGMRAHLRVVNNRDEVLVDEDVNRVNIDTMLRYETWESGAKDQADLHEISLSGLQELTLTPVSDRLAKANPE